MRTAVLTPFDYFEFDRGKQVIIKMRTDVDGVWEKTRFLRFSTPIHESAIFEHVYERYDVDRIFTQTSFTVYTRGGEFF